MANKSSASSQISINTRRNKVWEAITNPELTRQYMFGCEVISDWKKGSELNWRMASDGKIMVKGNIAEIEPGRMLKYTTFDPNGKLEDKPENYAIVTYEITEENGKTILNVKQENIPVFHSKEEMKKNWQHTLEGLKKTAESL